jgi:hypothetical protein
MINYPITAAYVSDWGLREALREIVQNALDAGDMQIGRHNGDDNHWVISNQGSFDREVLLLGNSIKSDGAIGKYGEGMKLAMLVLARLNIAHYVEAGEASYRGVFDLSSFKEPTFVVYEGQSAASERVEFHIHYDISNIVHDIYKDIDHGFCEEGLYVNGLYVSDLPGFRYGYNMPNSEVNLDRDRRSIDTAVVKAYAAELILKEKTYAEIADLLFDQVQDVDTLFAITTSDQDREIGKACARLVQQRLNGGRIGWSGYGNESYTKVGYHFHHYAVNIGNCQKPELSATAKKLYEFVAVNRNKMRRDIREQLLEMASKL